MNEQPVQGDTQNFEESIWELYLEHTFRLCVCVSVCLLCSWKYFNCSRHTTPCDDMKLGTSRCHNCAWKFINLTLYAPCIILQYVYKPTRCTKFCDETLFSIRCSTCFELYQSIIRSNFISCTSDFVYAGTSGCCVAIPNTGIYQMRCTTYKVAPDDGLIQSETCGASNGK